MSTSVATSEDKFSRLPEIAKPLSYDIYLKPDLKSFKCKGKEDIVVEVIHSVNLSLSYAINF